VGNRRDYNEQAAEALEKQYKKLARQLKKSKEGNRADIATLKAFLELTMELIPVAKESYRQYRSDRGIYALNGLVNQAREIMNDLRQLRTGKKQHQHIVNKIILPNLAILMQHFMADCTELKKEIAGLDRKTRNRLTEKINGMMTAQGLLFQEVSGKTQTALAEFLIA